MYHKEFVSDSIVSPTNKLSHKFDKKKMGTSKSGFSIGDSSKNNFTGALKQGEQEIKSPVKRRQCIQEKEHKLQHRSSSMNESDFGMQIKDILSISFHYRSMQ